MQKGLRESVRGSWEGDEDLGDGSVQMLFKEYNTRRHLVKDIGIEKRLGLIQSDCRKVKGEIERDVLFLMEGNERARESYNKAVDGGHSAESKLMALAWDVTGFQELLKKAKELILELDGVLNDDCVNLSSFFVTFKPCLHLYLKELFSKKRVAAGYLLTFMISDELRKKKPYAVPVQFVPYKSIADSQLRDLEVKLEKAMNNEGMTVVGKLFQNHIAAFIVSIETYSLLHQALHVQQCVICMDLSNIK